MFLMEFGEKVLFTCSGPTVKIRFILEIALRLIIWT